MPHLFGGNEREMSMISQEEEEEDE